MIVSRNTGARRIWSAEIVYGDNGSAELVLDGMVRRRIMNIVGTLITVDTGMGVEAYREIKADARELHRANEYANLAGEEAPYPALLHAHEWDSNDYCMICGADGRA